MMPQTVGVVHNFTFCIHRITGTLPTPTCTANAASDHILLDDAPDGRGGGDGEAHEGEDEAEVLGGVHMPGFGPARAIVDDVDGDDAQHGAEEDNHKQVAVAVDEVGPEVLGAPHGQEHGRPARVEERHEASHVLHKKKNWRYTSRKDNNE